ncbi:lipoyl(octanoyl) transferase LipB [Suttonella ornithocola]|uniref:Octanoyltransferase n=1 Tax=Suttonella ornithocola TaxID=279832 RepID=A0A380MM64_9GAMM|nr:lipoyl(octanoyl) transferase LipB [Suttonella ornithocola]SUO93700.1 Octanoyltransferase [Suttonella ornithocola]
MTHSTSTSSIPLKNLGLQDYLSVFEAMRDYTKNRGSSEDDVLWFVEHPPVFTQGLAGKSEHLLNPGEIPVVPIDRGGQVTYHGPGQAIIYLLLDIKSANIGVRPLVSLIENTTVSALAQLGISAHPRADAPGVYVEDGRKIASLGLKLSHGCTYHGIAINVDMDLSPFARINPCGLIGMKMAQINEWQPITPFEFAQLWHQTFNQKWAQLRTHSIDS